MRRRSTSTLTFATVRARLPVGEHGNAIVDI